MSYKQRVKYILSYIKNSLRFLGKGINVHSTTWVPFKCKIETNLGGNVSIGCNCELHDYSIIMTYGGNIVIGDDCSVNPFSILYGHGGLKIGRGVRIAAHVVIVPANHIPGDEELPLYRRGIVAKGIEIGDYTWIGAGSRILDGVTIGRHVIIGAGSVVTASIPDGAVAVGVPARIITKKPSIV